MADAAPSRNYPDEINDGSPQLVSCEEIRDLLVPVVEDTLNRKGEVTDAKAFIKDLDADSLDLVQMIMDMEDQLHVHIPEEKSEHMKTVADVLRYVCDLYGIEYVPDGSVTEGCEPDAETA